MTKKKDPDHRRVTSPGRSFGAFVSLEIVEFYRKTEKMIGPVVKLERITPRPHGKTHVYWCTKRGYCQHQTPRGLCRTEGLPERKNCQFCSTVKPRPQRGFPKT